MSLKIIRQMVFVIIKYLSIFVDNAHKKTYLCYNDIKNSYLKPRKVIDMILKVVLVQPVCDYYKQDFKKSTDGLNKKKSTSFASILENAIKSQ